MKLYSKNGRFEIRDNERIVVYDSIVEAMSYIFLMMQLRHIPYTSPSLSPVRSLVPHPKKLVLKKSDLIRIGIMKSNLPRWET